MIMDITDYMEKTYCFDLEDVFLIEVSRQRIQSDLIISFKNGKRETLYFKDPEGAEIVKDFILSKCEKEICRYDLLH